MWEEYCRRDYWREYYTGYLKENSEQQVLKECD